MKVYISMDAEGISGIFKLAQVMPGHPEYDYARKLMAGDVNAAVAGAFDAGAETVFVNDAHNSGDNLHITDLDERAVLCSGADRPFTMAEGAQKGFDAALLIGYHTRKGSKGVISHSYAYGSMVEMRLNDKIISEYELIGYMIGYYGTPVVFISGDDIVTADAKENVPGIHAVAVKECVSNGAASCIHPNVTARMIRGEVKKALSNLAEEGIKPMTVEGPVRIDVRYTAEAQAWKAMMVPNTERIGETTVRYHGKDYKEAYLAFVAGTVLAGSFGDDAAFYAHK